jgi:hypothetical protein
MYALLVGSKTIFSNYLCKIWKTGLTVPQQQRRGPHQSKETAFPSPSNTTPSIKFQWKYRPIRKDYTVKAIRKAEEE